MFNGGQTTFAPSESREQYDSAAHEVLLTNDHTLMNGRQLAAKLGVKYEFVKDMRLAGFHPPISGLTTLSYATNWLNRNPNFRADARILKLARKPKRYVNPQP
jgi:hypothetical protein